MFIKFDEEKAVETQGGAGSKVLDTGVYTVEIVTASKTVASTGTVGIDWSIQVEGHKYPNMVYNMWIQKANGDALFNLPIVQNLMGIAGVKGLTEYKKEIEIKDGTKTVDAFKELENVKCKVAIQKVFDFYNGEVRESNEIKQFFSLDGKTFAESKSNSDAKQIVYFETKLKDNYTDKYKKAKADGDLDEQGTAEDTGAEEEESGSLL
jgi:hypothetical protein